MKKKPPTHGGARPGAGRPPSEIPTAARTVRLPVADWQYLDGTGNASKAVREAVAMHRKKAARFVQSPSSADRGSGRPQSFEGPTDPS